MNMLVSIGILIPVVLVIALNNRQSDMTVDDFIKKITPEIMETTRAAAQIAFDTGMEKAQKLGKNIHSKKGEKQLTRTIKAAFKQEFLKKSENMFEVGTIMSGKLKDSATTMVDSDTTDL